MANLVDPNSKRPPLNGNEPAQSAAPQALIGGLGPDHATPARPVSAAGLQASEDVVKDGSQDTFALDVIEASQSVPIIVYFTAPWCEPCKKLGPAMDKQVRKAGGTVRMVKINVDNNQTLASQLRVQSVPMVIAFSKGRPVDGFQGAVPDSQINQFIKRLIGDAKPPIEAALEQAAELLAAGDPDGAHEIYIQIMDADTDNAVAVGGLIRCAVATKEFETAHEIIAGLTPELLRHPDLSAAVSALELAETSSTPDDVAPLQAQLEENPDDHQARYDLAMAYYGAGQNQPAIDALLEIIRRERSWNDEAARLQLLKIFEAIGHAHPITIDSRRQLSTILFS